MFTKRVLNLGEIKMIKKLMILGMVLILGICGLSGCLGPQTTDYFNGEYDVTEDTILKVTTFNGQIEINFWDGETVSFNAIKKSRLGQDELDKAEINVLESDDLIEIVAEYVGTRSTTPSVDMNIKIPKNVTVEYVKTSNGAILINEVKGNISVTTSNGDIEIENIKGYISASTSNGRIDVKDTTGVKDLKTSNGRIYAEIFDFIDDITISSSNGGIEIYINPQLNADIEMTTSNGQISISGISLNVTNSEDKHIVGKLGLGGNKIDIHTSNGNIYLRKLEV
jgi:DUF4097 and DUF4098 domain-containing protein YvlB